MVKYGKTPEEHSVSSVDIWLVSDKHFCWNIPIRGFTGRKNQIVEMALNGSGMRDTACVESESDDRDEPMKKEPELQYVNEPILGDPAAKM